MHHRILSLLLAGGLLLFFVGTAQAQDDMADALKFNEAIVNANKRLEMIGEKFGRQIAMALSGKPNDIANVKKGYAEVQKVLKSVQADMKKLADEIPDSAEAKEFYQAHQKFLKGQERMVKVEFQQIVDVVSDTTLDADEKLEKIKEILVSVEKIEQADLKVLQAAQRKFAKKHGIILK